MEGIAAYADEGSNSSLIEEGSSDQEETDQVDVMGPGDDSARDGYRGDDSDQAEHSVDSGEIEDSQDPPQHRDNPLNAYENERKLSAASGMAPGAMSQEISNNEDGSNQEKNSDSNEFEEEDGERTLPQEVTTPFSLASFLSSMTPQITEDGPSQEKNEKDLEFAYVNGTYVRVAKSKVDMNELDRRLDDLRDQRREEIGLLRMYGLDDRDDRGGRREDGRGSREGRDRGRDHEDSRRRSRSRSRDRDRDRRRSRSRDRRRSRSRERRRSRSRDRSNRRERDSPDRSRGRDDKDRFGRDRDRFGRDREDRDRFARDKDRFGRDKDRFGRERRDLSREREDRKDDKEHSHSRSPRSDRRDSNNRDRQSSGRGQDSMNQFRDGEKHKQDDQDQSMYGRSDDAFSRGQDFYPQQPPVQQPPLPVPPPESFPHGQFHGPQSGGFSQPPPPLDPYASAVPPPQPWMGPGFQQQVPPPQQPPAPTHLLASTGFSQPPPPSGVNPMNNGDMNMLKKSLSMLTGSSDASLGTPAMSGGAPGYGGAAPDPSQPSLAAIGERFSSYGRDTGYSDTGSTHDDEPMDLDLPEPMGGSDDFQNRVVEEVKNAIRPYFNSRQISKDDYREILKKCVPKVINSGEINQKKIGNLVGAYVKKMKGGRSK